MKKQAVVKRLVILTLVLALSFFAYQYFFGKPKEIFITIDDPYGAALCKIHDQVFADLDTRSPNPTAKLQRLRGMADLSIHTSGADANVCHIALRLCDQLSEANHEREQREARLKHIRSKEFDSLSTRGAKRQKQFYEATEQRKWKNYVLNSRPTCQRLLKQLTTIERNTSKK